MTQPLKLLIAEDNPADAELLLRALRKAGFEPEWKRVQTEPDFLAALHEGLDLVLSDYEMPQFNGLRALALVQQRGLEVPFILISGTIGEELAVAAMKEGAADYLLKDRLTRLGPAVAHALEETRRRRERRLAAEDFKMLFAQNPMPMWVYELDLLRFIAVNDAAVEHYGYTREEFLTLTLKDIRPPDEVPRMLQSVRGRRRGITRPGVWQHRKKDGGLIMVETTAHRTVFQGRPAELVLAQDVTLQLGAENALRESEERLRIVTDNARVGLVMVNRERCYTFANGAYAAILDLSSTQISGRSVAEVVGAVYEEQIRPRLDQAFAGQRVTYELTRCYGDKTRYYSVCYEPTKMQADGGAALVVVVIMETTERMQAELKIRDQLAELLRWQEVMLGREDRVQTLKAEVNALLAQAGQAPRYGGEGAS